MSLGSAQGADAPPGGRRREQRAWYFYDWANSAYVTSVATVLFSPYLTTVAERAACGRVSTVDNPCNQNLGVLGISVSAGSVAFYAITFATLLSALFLPLVGAVADRSGSKRRLMAGFAWLGSIAAGCMFFVAGTNWQLGVVLLLVAHVSLGASLVAYDAILVEIAAPDERDRVSSRGWALGYLGGAILLAVNLGLVTLHDMVGISTEMAVRVSLLSAAAWWAGFTWIPYLGIKDRAPATSSHDGEGLVQRSFGQLAATLREARHYPQTLLFLLAYLFYNDGIQTVIYAASVYGEKQLGFGTDFLIVAILIVQFVAFGGALLFGRVAESLGTRSTIMAGLAIWMLVVIAGYFIPAKQAVPFIVLAVAIGLVMGGTQALSRSFFSQLIPRGRAAEYFSLYQACERGTSWLGTLVFGLVHQLTDSYRPAIVALVVFFAVGLALLARLDPERAITEAGNPVPERV